MNPSSTARRSPYKGLIPYAEDDAPFFFGREKETRLISANLFASALTLLYGASGVGKSSVLRAGVAHQLRQREDLLVVVFNSWQSEPAAALQLTIAKCAADADREGWGKVEEGLLIGRIRSLPDFLTACATHLNRRLMIILDQFEEYFLYHPQDDQFGAEFPKAVMQPDAPVSFLISIREDFYAKLDRFEGRIPTLYDNYLRIEHLDRNAARVAIKEPIAQYNRRYASDGHQFSIEPELVEAVLTQVETGQVILGESGRGVIETTKSDADAEAQIETPFLQLVMTRLWEKELSVDSQILRLKTLDDLGGAANIVRTHLDAVITKLQPREQEIAANVFHYLVTPSGTKIAYSASDLAGSAELNEAEVVQVLEKLSHGDVRILRPVDPPADRPTAPRYEIFHDVLAPAILTWRTSYVQAQERAEAERNLALAAEERRKTEDQLARERKLGARLRFAMVGLALLMLLMGAVTVWAFQQQRKAVVAQAEAEKHRKIAEQQSTEAQTARSTAEDAKRDAIEQRDVAKGAFEEAQKQQEIAEQAAIAANAAQKKEAAQRKETERALNTASVALEGKIRAEMARDQQEAINKLRTEVEVARVPLENNPGRSLSRATKVMESLHSLKIDDPESSYRAEDILRRSLLALDESKMKQVLDGHTDTVDGVYFSPDGNLLVTTEGEGVANVWKISNGNWNKVDSTMLGVPIKKVAFSRDGSYFITLSDNAVTRWEVDSLYSPRGQTTARDAIFAPGDDSILVTHENGGLSRWLGPGGELVPITHPALSPTDRRGSHDDSIVLNSDGTLALVYGDSGTRVWEVGTERPLLELASTKTPDGAAFSRDGKYVAISSGPLDPVSVYVISEWRNAPLPLKTPAPAPTSPEAELSPAPSGEATATPSPGGEATPTTSPQLQQPISLTIPGRRAVTRLEFSPTDSDVLLTFTADGATLLWRVSQKESLEVQQKQNADTVHALFSPDGEYVVLLDSRGTARVWNIRKQAVFVTLRGHEGALLSAAFSPRDGSLVTASYDQTARVWEWQPKTWRANPLNLGDAPVESEGPVSAGLEARFSDDGRSILTAYTSARIWPVTGAEKPSAEFSSGDLATFSSDGLRIAVADKVPVVQLTDAGSGKINADVSGQTGEVRSAVFSPDSRYLLTFGADKIARVLDVATGTAVVLNGQSSMVAAAFVAGGQQLVTVGGEGTVRVWKWQTEEGRKDPFAFKTPSARVAAISADGSYIATASTSREVNVWDATGKQVTQIRGFRSLIRSIAFSPDNKHVLGVEDYGVRVLKLATPGSQTGQGTELVYNTKERTSALPARGASFSPDGRFVVTGGGKLVQVWDLSIARAPRRVAFGRLESGRIRGIAYSPKGSYITAAVDDGMHVWKAPTIMGEMQSIGEEVAMVGDLPFGRTTRPVDIAFSADEERIFASERDSRSVVWEWRSAAGREKPSFVSGKVAALSPDGRLVFSARMAEVIRIHETKTPAPNAPLVISGIEGPIHALGLNRDGGVVAAEVMFGTGEAQYRKVLLWDGKTGARRAAIPLPGSDSESHLTFSTDGRLFAVASKRELLLFNANDGESVPVRVEEKDKVGAHKGDINSIAFSPDGRFVLTASSDRTARVWDVKAGKAVLPLRGHFGEVTSASFSHDAEFIVTTSNDKTARVWRWTPPAQIGDLGELIGETVALEGHTGPVLAAAFDRERRFVVTGSADNTARLWNARSGQVLAELVGQLNDVLSVAFGQDGKSILTLGADGTAQIYICGRCGNVEELLSEARQRVKKDTP